MPLVRRVARTAARTAVVAGTATAISGRVHRRQERRWAQQEQRADGAPPQGDGTPPPPVPSEADQTVVELQQLARLRDQGILTDEEFTAKKQQVLGI